jgi:hypothetical protein
METMNVDRLVLLLSTDWFAPYWGSIGLEAQGTSKSSVQLGCRRIVQQILSGVERYDLVSFSPERLGMTRSLLDSLLSSSEAKRDQRIAEKWAQTSDEDLKAASICSDLTEDLVFGKIQDNEPRLDSFIFEIVAGARRAYDVEPFEFEAICEASESSWDKYVKQLTPELPAALAYDLAAILTAIRFEAMWMSVKNRLSSTQRESVVTWYREVARARGRRSIVPTFMTE